jgi:hypothetical protein
MSDGAPNPAKRRRAKGGGAAAAAPESLSSSSLFAAAGGPTDDPLMRGPGTAAGQGTASGPEAAAGPEADDELPAVMVSIFKSAKLADIRAANAANGLPSEPSEQSSYLRPGMHFSIVPRAPSMMSRVFEMIAAVLSRSGGREAANSIGFTVVMLNGAPQLAIDVGDERFTFVVSVRITADIYLHPDWQSGSGAAQFPVLGVRCRSMVEKLNQARDFHRVLLYQNRGSEDQLNVVIDTPDRAGNVQHETIKIQSDEWESLELRDIRHRFTMQVAIKMLLQLCRIQREAQGHMTISIHSPDAPPPPPTPVPDAAEMESGTADVEPSQQPAAPPAPVRERQNYILRLAVQNAEGEESSMLRPIVNEIERRVDPATGETITTLHYCEEQPNVGIDLISKLPGYHTLYKQSFSAGYVDAFLSKFDPNKMITIRLADDTPMVMSYLHGGLVVCQMVISPIYEAAD